jgi:RsiW-degrading membrane proteinase PrsW (M82 family)
MLVLAASLLLCALCSFVLYVVVPFRSPDVETSTQSNIVLGSLAGFGIVFGALLVWQGIRTLQGRASVPAARAFPPVPALVLAFVGALLLGVGALELPAYAAYLFPPWHLLAASLPPLALLAYGARRLGAASGLRALLASFGWGALAGTTIAFLLEAIAGLILIVVVSIVVSALPNSRELLDQLQAQLQQAQRTRDFSGLTEMLSQPAVTIGLLVFLAVVIPLIEEFVKALVIAFIDPRRTGPAEALLWGMGAGAGFATIESILNASVVVSAWAPLVLSRVGAAIVHVANGALMGRGWYAARVERRWGQLVLSYGASVLFHALWNAMAVVLSTQIPSFAGGSFSSAGVVLTAVILLTMVLLALAGLAWIVYAVRTQSRRQPATELAI